MEHIEITMQSSFTPFFDDIQPKTTIHIRIQQRTSRKSITIIEGLASDLDLTKILKYMKKNFKCNGKVQKEDNVIQLQGDQREISQEFILDMGIVESKADIHIHGS